MNTRLLRRIQKQILKEPLQFVMGNWFQHGPVLKEGRSVSIPNCGTAACIGGWALAFSRKVNPMEANDLYLATATTTAKALPLMPVPVCEPLGLTLDQAKRLCFFDRWPIQFRQANQNDAKQAAARIEHFIKTKGEE